ncbi:class I SAM-dependent methyltransferase [Alkalicoccus daliensis]|uniref:Methyltransferase domain-containing protein n=1 Tax=Alkalicoccus daliensis TaxID=745820 RepID=A0A1H0GUG8_9BACI|nr:class I SAM-dependent methyltransferase [Alkalicoccus daliensis]SDO10530.1 Methyltransferase domain-containing protein [Alkalicoccus daliensis]
MFAKLYDPLMKPLDIILIYKVRNRLLQKAYGEVLEIGSGTGLNFPHYPSAAEQITAIEPQRKLRDKSLPRAIRAGNSITVHEGIAEALPYPDNSFDTVVNTLVFCTIPEPEKAMKEIVRTVKPGGTVLFYEHVQPKNEVMRAVFNKATPLWKRICDGCHLNRDTETLIRNSPLEIVEKQASLNEIFIEITAKLPTEL